MIHEDLLLSRIDILENKLVCYQKNITNEKLQEEIIKLQDDKSIYQVNSKHSSRHSGHSYNYCIFIYFFRCRNPQRKP